MEPEIFSGSQNERKRMSGKLSAEPRCYRRDPCEANRQSVAGGGDSVGRWAEPDGRFIRLAAAERATAEGAAAETAIVPVDFAEAVSEYGSQRGRTVLRLESVDDWAEAIKR